MLRRPRRNRKNPVIRNLIKETHVTKEDLIYPLFVTDLGSKNEKIEVSSMPGIFRHSETSLLREVEECLGLGVSTVCIFPAIDEKLKTKDGRVALDPQQLYLRSIRSLRREFPSLCIMTDVALDPYSSDGHDGLVDGDKILNDESLEILAAMAVAQAEAGADIVGPSDMMDGRVKAIRLALDAAGFSEVSIMSYTAKYASSFYGPFRHALDSAPKKGDKKTYQMDFSNRREAQLEAHLDEEEGADFLMVKPALSYLDVIQELRQQSSLPIAAYNVSGEYAIVKAGAEKGWIQNDLAAMEILTSIKRAGADIILSYFTKEVLEKKLIG